MEPKIIRDLEIEFEDQVPNQFKNKPNLKGWEILKPN